MLKRSRFLLGVTLASALAAGGILTAGVARPGTQHVELVGAGSITDGTAMSPAAISVAAGDRSPFRIVGGVAGLFPGATRPLTLTVDNPYARSITVVSLTTTVGPASTRCNSTNLAVSTFTGQLVVAAGRTAKLTVTATMPHSTGNGCQGAVFPLTYQARATIS